MAKYEHLPLYRELMKLNVYLDKQVRDFSKYHKYSIGSQLRSYAQDALLMVIKVNNSTDKLPNLESLRFTMEALKTLFYLGKEIQAFTSFAAFKEGAELVLNGCKQVEGWIRSVKKMSRN